MSCSVVTMGFTDPVNECLVGRAGSTAHELTCRSITFDLAGSPCRRRSVATSVTTVPRHANKDAHQS